ncbi:MAG: lipid A export permease/ATP-binding protein MsbA [Deltaproteobacteria bacterium RBG_13_52_11b]|nr:MAG: lipid A export permease/ATP-binding protein MsbA [Deltaproteobacteria bacterium RBG_13_52_11b]
MILYRRLIELIKPYWRKLTIAMICMVFVSLLEGGQAYLVKPALDEVFINKDAKKLFLLPFVIVILFLAKGIFNYVQAYLMNFVGLRVVANLRAKLYDHLQTLSLSFFTKTSTGILISRITNDVNLIQGSVSNVITGLLKDIFTIIALIGVIFYQNWKLAIIALIVFPLAIIPIKEFGKRLRKFSRRSQEQMGSITTFLHETITGNRIVKAFSMEEYEKRRFAQENDRFFMTVFKRAKIRALSHPLMELIGGVGAAFVIWVGGYSVIRGETTPGTFFSFMAALFMLYNPIRDLNKVNLEIQEGLAAAARVYELLDTLPDIKDETGALPLLPISKEIDFQNVTFKYDGEPVLRNISFQVRTGEVVAIVGMSGAGKTSLVNLLPRFYDIEEGHILFDGCDIRKVTIQSLRNQIGLVTQQTILFNDTVRNNIAYGSQERTDQEMIEAAKAANAHDFIMRLSQGYDTLIGEQGVKLSGGERQRLSIARALLKNAPILILDEATSSLDSDSETEVQKALDRLMENRTVFVIAHRLSTIRNAHRILVLSSGELVEEGNHNELMAREGEYHRLHELQFKDNDAELRKSPEEDQIY